MIVNTMSAASPMVVVTAVALEQAVMKTIMATSTLQEHGAIPVLLLILGHPMLMVQDIERRDIRLITLRILEDMIIVNAPHHLLVMMEDLWTDVQRHSLHILIRALVIMEASKTLTHIIVMIATIAMGVRVLVTVDLPHLRVGTADDAIMQMITVSRRQKV